MARWWKKMSRTDAQQPTKGYLVAYLRLTKNRAKFDPNTWFKQVLFAGVTWGPGFHGRHAVDEAHAKFRVVDGSKDLGVFTLKLTHDHGRPANHKHPATWIHWDGLQGYLHANSREGWYVSVERDPSTTPALTITFTTQKPTWRPGT